MDASEAKKRVIKKFPQAQIAPWTNGGFLEVINSRAGMRTLGVGPTEEHAWLNAADKLNERKNK